MVYSDNGFFDNYGGKYVAEVLSRPLEELKEAFEKAKKDPSFIEELETIQRDYIGRETPLLFAETATKLLGGAQIYIKLEGLANTGAHKINNAIGQCLLAKRMGKNRIIAETGAGQHGVATAAACAKLGLDCTVYMGEVDVRRQQPNVAAMELYGAKVHPVTSGSRTLKDAVNEAMRCLKCRTKPCTKGCPVMIRIPDFVRHSKREAEKVVHQDCRDICLCPGSTRLAGFCCPKVFVHALTQLAAADYSAADTLVPGFTDFLEVAGMEAVRKTFRCASSYAVICPGTGFWSGSAGP